MKKTAIKLLTAILIGAMLLGLFTSCAGLGDTAMELGKAKITGNMIEFWLSRYKASFLQYYGDSVKAEYGLTSKDDIWTIKDKATGETYDDLFTEYIIENAKTYLCAMYLFDQFGLSLDKETVKAVDEYLDDLKEVYGGGSKSEFNASLAAYGANYNILREIFLIEEKVGKLQDYLYGADGIEKISDAEVEAYYQANYVRMKEICVFINERPMTDGNGKFITDSNGYVKYETMSAAENEAARAKAEEALAKIRTGSDFETVLASYDENVADDIYVNGLYMSAESAYGNDADLQLIFDTLQKMTVGEVRLVELSHNLTIVKKYELDAGAYNKSSNSDFFVFTDQNGNQQSFAQYLVTPTFLKYISDRLEKYDADVKLYDEIISQYKISKVNANYNY